MARNLPPQADLLKVGDESNAAGVGVVKGEPAPRSHSLANPHVQGHHLACWGCAGRGACPVPVEIPTAL